MELHTLTSIGGTGTQLELIVNSAEERRLFRTVGSKRYKTMEDDSSYSKLQLCLTWNSFTDNIVSSLESSYGDGDFVDVTLACEGESIKAHKLVLSACSQYLKRLLKENPCPHPIIILKDVGLAELKDLLIYMYHGEVRVEQERIAKLLHTAQILEIRGLRDINQKLDQELDSGINETSSLITAASEGSQNQDTSTADEYNGKQQNSVSNNTLTVQRKLLSNSSKKRTALHARSVLKSSVGRKPRPIPMLQSIQQSGKMDGNAVMPMSVDRDEDEGGGEESNNSSLAPDHTVFLDDVRVKEETPDVSEQFEFATNQSSTLDENSSDTDQRGFNNGFANPSMVLTLGGGSLCGGLLAAQMLKRVATRASSNEGVSVVKEAVSLGNIVVNSSVADQGSATKTQEDSQSDEVTVSLFNAGSQRWKMSSNATAQSLSPSETDKQNQSMSLKPWEVLKLADRNDDRQKTPISSDLSSDKSYENLTENMDLDSLHFWRNNSFHQTSDQQAHRNSKQTMDIEFVRPGEYVQKERRTSSKFQAIEHMLNITPQLRLQMLMCREYKKYTNILLVAMFGRDMLATHSLNGTGTSKPKLDGQKVNHVIDAVMAKFGVDQNHVKEAIRIKLNNEDKLRKRLTQKISIGVGSL
ncbi:broad-complex core protein isoforms 1/2/3/4/5 isoform X2 [Cryptotermes secundus]|uniref:broad-complex core protein isoforms 1/2/3/4/5 isoform X2 n=1 Tax=Cryptotermes secundus TaxID=105785 RepID=UPI000CD7C7AB|nr:broad-complex core protein isoforms 1/2/3/4/5 isoform X2 [Cryptotermes secundus]